MNSVRRNRLKISLIDFYRLSTKLLTGKRFLATLLIFCQLNCILTQSYASSPYFDQIHNYQEYRSACTNNIQDNTIPNYYTNKPTQENTSFRNFYQNPFSATKLIVSNSINMIKNWISLEIRYVPLTFTHSAYTLSETDNQLSKQKSGNCYLTKKEDGHCSSTLQTTNSRANFLQAITSIQSIVKQPIKSLMYALLIQLIMAQTALPLSNQTTMNKYRLLNGGDNSYPVKHDYYMNEYNEYMDSPSNISNQFIINQNQTQGQFDPIVIKLTNGNAFITWLGSQSGNYDVYGRIFNPNGTAITDEFTINNNTQGDQAALSVAPLNDGNAIISWNVRQVGNNDVIYARIISSEGDYLTNDFQVNQNTSSYRSKSAIASLDNNNIFLTWFGMQTGDYNIYGRIFNQAGNPLGDDFMINQNTAADQAYPAISATDNNVFIAWNSNHAGFNNIYGRVFNENGVSQTEEFAISQIPYSYPKYPGLLKVNTGNLLVSWETTQNSNDHLVYARIYNISGSALNDNFIIANDTERQKYDLKLTLFGENNIFGTWVNSQFKNNFYDVYGQLLDMIGTPLTDEFMISHNVTVNQNFQNAVELANGNVFTVWSGFTKNDYDIYCKILTTDYLDSLMYTTNTSYLSTSMLTSSMTPSATSSSSSTPATVTSNALTASLLTSSMSTVSLLTSSTGPIKYETSNEATFNKLPVVYGVVGATIGLAVSSLGGVIAWKYYRQHKSKYITEDISLELESLRLIKL